jgi:hypothetical protein
MATPIILGERPSALAACNTAKRLVFSCQSRPGSIAALLENKKDMFSPYELFLGRATGIDGVCPYAPSRSSIGRSTPGEHPATNNWKSLPRLSAVGFSVGFVAQQCCAT